MWSVTPQAATLEELLGELILHLARLPRGLVFEAHRLLYRRDLPVGQFTGPVMDDRRQRAARYKQVDEVAIEGIGGPAQRVQAAPVGGFRLLEPRYRP